MTARRILIYGVTGSGKSTLGRRLAEKTGIPYHEADAISWKPNWTEVPLEEQRARIGEICSGDEWILDSAYAKWLDLVLPRADAIIALDYPRITSFSRLFRRTMSRIIDKTPVCNGNIESLQTLLSRESILLWHFKSYGTKKRRMREWAESDRRVIVLRTPRETEEWLEGISGNRLGKSENP